MNALSANPLSGRPVQTMAAEFREKISPFGGSAYFALYRCAGQDVVVLAVRHAREAGY